MAIDARRQLLLTADNNRGLAAGLDRETIEGFGWYEACFSRDRLEHFQKGEGTMLTINDVTSLSSRLACVLGLLVFPSVGCSDVGSDGGAGGTAATGGAPGTGGTGGMGGGPPTTACVQLFLSVSEFNADGSQSASEGTTICQISGNDTRCGMSPDNCVTTTADGKAVLDLPANREVVYTLDKDGYSPIVHGRVTDETFSGMAGGPMVPHEQGEALAAQLGTP